MTVEGFDQAREDALNAELAAFSSGYLSDLE